MSISEAIDKIYFAERCDFEFYISCLSNTEAVEELEELEDAYETVRKAGILITDDILDKKRDRDLNKQQPPIRFIDRIPIRAVDLDELPF